MFPALITWLPFGNFCLVVRGQCIWRLQHTRRHFETQLRKAFARYWICQRVYHRGIEFGDYILFGAPLGTHIPDHKVM